MKKEIENFIELIEKSGYSIEKLGFSKGADESQISKIESVIKQTLPEDFKLFLSYINGQRNENFFFLPEQVKLLSCKEIISGWKEEDEYAEDSDEFYNDFQNDDKIRGSVFLKSRIPIAAQEDGGKIYIDNDPGPKGKVGQIIFLVDECDFIVLADSFREFISNYNKAMDNGILKFENEEEGYSNKYRLKSDAEYMDGEEFVAIFNA
jgi:cell wall assembly regulator SMI1